MRAPAASSEGALADARSLLTQRWTQAAFRAEVARRLPAAHDDAAWTQKVAWACAAWFVGFFTPVVTRELDREQDRGPLSARHAAFAHLDAVARAGDGHYPTVAGLAHHLGTALRSRWGVAHVAGYPAFRSQGGGP